MKLREEHWCAALSYLIIGILWYFVEERMRKNEFAKYHVKQGLVLLIVAIILNVLNIIPFIGNIIAVVANALVFIWVILGVVHALSNQKKPLFFIGGFADNFTF